jgi:hypothetical protein
MIGLIIKKKGMVASACTEREARRTKRTGCHSLTVTGGAEVDGRIAFFLPPPPSSRPGGRLSRLPWWWWWWVVDVEV